MATGTKSMTVTGNNVESWKARISYSSTAYPESNSSKVTIKYQIYRDIEGETINSSQYSGTFRYDISGNGKDSTAAEKFSFSNVTVTVKPKTWTTIKSFTTTVKHRSDGRRSMYIWGEFSNSFLSAKRNPVWIDMDIIAVGATISSATNFTDEDEVGPTMTYTVPSPNNTTKLEACISLDGTKDDIPYRDIDINQTSYTFDFTLEERATLRSAPLTNGNSRTVYFMLRSTVGGSTFIKDLAKTYTISGAEPEISVFVLDTNDKTLALTGDALAFMIQGQSNISYEISATAKKDAEIVSYSATNGSKVLTDASGVFEKANNATFIFTATDSRGATATKEITLNMLEYFKPSCNQEVKFEVNDNEAATATIKVEGSWCSKHYGAAHNQLRIGYRYKTGPEEEYTEWFDAEYLTDTNEYKITFTNETLDYSKPHTFQCHAVDSLDESLSAEYTAVLVPVFDWSEKDFNFNVPLWIEGYPLADYVIETGTDRMGTNGTWYWQKWKSGKAECWGTRNYGNMAISTAWGDLYVSEDFTQSLPSGLFGEPPYHISIEPMSGGYGTWVSKGYKDAATTDDTCTFCLVRAKSNTLSQVNIGFHIIGSWMEPLG